MQSVLANSHLALSNVSFAPKTSQNSNLGQNGPKAVQNDVKVGWSTSMVPKGITRMQTFAVSRENDGIAERRMCIRARFRREKSDLSGANDKEDSEIGERLIIRENHTNSDIYTRKDITSDLAKDPRIAIDEDDFDAPEYKHDRYASGDRKTLKSSGPSTGLFGKLKVQKIRTRSRQESKHEMDIPSSSGEFIAETKNLHKNGRKPETFGAKNKVDSLKFNKEGSEFAAQSTQQSKRGLDIPGRRWDFIPETEKLYGGKGKPENDRPQSKVKSLKLRREGIKFASSHKAFQETENIYGGRGNSMSYPPKSKIKPLNASRGEGTKFGAGGDFFSLKSFEDLGSSEDMLKVLKAQRIYRPSHIQAMAYRHILNGQSCIVAEQSGSGKTLAYLAPLVQRLREEEMQSKSKSFAKSPRVLVLVPTAELAAQVLNACRAISKAGMPFRSMVATGGFKWKTQLESLEQCTDILIATPGRFRLLLQEGQLQLSNLMSIVLDEVDILFDDEEFSPALDKIMNTAPLAAQYLFVTATLPLDVHNRLLEKFPDCKAIMGPGLHRTCSGLEEILVDCSGEGEEKNPETAFSNKRSALLQLVEQSPVRKTILFCNKIETCRKIENLLNRFDRRGSKICVLPFHAAVSQESRISNMQQFLDSQSEESLFLVCTDRASRGLDLINVDHVVLFDFPRDPSEYVRRVGRTARGAGGRGKAFIFVVGKQVSLALRIIDRNEKGHPLHALPSDL